MMRGSSRFASTFAASARARASTTKGAARSKTCARPGLFKRAISGKSRTLAGFSFGSRVGMEVGINGRARRESDQHRHARRQVRFRISRSMPQADSLRPRRPRRVRRQSKNCAPSSRSLPAEAHARLDDHRERRSLLRRTPGRNEARHHRVDKEQDESADQRSDQNRQKGSSRF